MSKFKKCLHVHFINLACLSSETHNLQRVFLRIYDAKGGSLFQAFLEETAKTGNKNRCVVETTHILLPYFAFFSETCRSTNSIT